MRSSHKDESVRSLWNSSFLRALAILVAIALACQATFAWAEEESKAEPQEETVATEEPSDPNAPPVPGEIQQVQYIEPEGQYVETDGQYLEMEGVGPACDECGTAASCPSCCPCPPSRLWARVEYLLWWSDGFSTPPLVTTSVDGMARTVAGVLEEPGTSVLAGGNGFGGNANSGWRITLGSLPDCGQMVGFQVGYYGFGNSSTSHGFDNTDYSILARPFYNIEPGSEGQDAELIAFPAFVEGQIDVSGTTTIQGVEVLMRSALHQGCASRIDVLAGWRFNRLDDELFISDTKTVLDASFGLAVGTVLDEYDRFETRNTFNGAELGVVLSKHHCRWSFEAMMKLAFGNNRSHVTIDGQTIVTVPVPGGSPDVAVTPAGLLAQETNIGEYQRDVFAMVPELGVTVGYCLTPRLRATFGYSFLYFSNVVRPGEAIDTELNLSQLDGALNGSPHPLFTWNTTDAWVQGVNFGLNYRF